MKFNPKTVALYTGMLFAAIHLVWSLMVAVGLGQIYLDWVLGLHFITNPFVVGPFNVVTMIILLAFTFTVGYMLGWVSTICWNKMVKK